MPLYLASTICSMHYISYCFWSKTSQQAGKVGTVIPTSIQEKRNSEKLCNLFKVSQLRRGTVRIWTWWPAPLVCGRACTQAFARVLLTQVWDLAGIMGACTLTSGLWLWFPLTNLRTHGLGAIEQSGSKGIHCAWLQIPCGAKCIPGSSFDSTHRAYRNVETMAAAGNL